MPRRVVVGVVLVAAAAGFAIGRATDDGSTQPRSSVTSTSTTARATTSSAPSTSTTGPDYGDAPVCTASQLDVVLQGDGMGAGNLVAGVAIVNRGEACWLSGFPSLAFFIGGGRQVAVAVFQQTEIAVPTHVVLTPDRRPLVAGRSFSGDATFTFTAPQHRSAGDPPAHDVQRIEVVLPGVATAKRVDTTAIPSDVPQIQVTDSALVGPIRPAE